MAFYDLAKEERAQLSEEIRREIREFLSMNQPEQMIKYFSDQDTYIRKAAYLATGRIWRESKDLAVRTISMLNVLFLHENEHVRQTVINAAGEIGMKEFDEVVNFFDKGLNDKHHAVRNAVIGSIKKMSEKNPHPVLAWAKKYLHHPDKEIRREICHGIELRGRTHPQEILPLLKELQDDKTARVRNTLIHVLGQIAYKKGCLETVLADLQTWSNKTLVIEALEEIIDVHHRYKDFSYLDQKAAKALVKANFPEFRGSC